MIITMVDRTAGGQRRRERLLKLEQARGAEVDHQEGGHGDDGGLHEGNRAGLQDQREGKRGAHEHDAGLHVELCAHAGFEPVRDLHEVADDDAHDQGHDRRFEAELLRQAPSGEDLDQDGHHVEEREAAQELGHVLAHDAHDDREDDGQYDVKDDRVREDPGHARQQAREVAVSRELDVEGAQDAGLPGCPKDQGDDDDAEADPYGPPVLLQIEALEAPAVGLGIVC